MIWMMGLWLSLWYPSDGYCLFEGVGDSSAAGSIYVQCLGAFSPAGGLVVDNHVMGALRLFHLPGDWWIDTHFMGYWHWHLVVNGDGHWNDLDDGMWLSLWYPSDGYCLFEGVGDSSAAGSIYVQCLGAFSPAGGLVIDTHFMGYWHLVVNGDGHWVIWMMGCGCPCGTLLTVLMVITHAGGLVFFDLDMKYWRIAVNGDGRRVEGGAVCLGDSAVLSMVGVNVDSNTAVLFAGGGISAGNGSQVLIDQSLVVNNTASMGSGGGIYGVGATIVVRGTSKVEDNNAKVDGGGVCVIGHGTLEMNASSVTGNQAAGDGGGIAVSTSSEAALRNGTVVERNSGGDGGGMAVSEGRISIVDATVRENTADGSAAGVLLDSGAEAEVEGSRFELHPGSALKVVGEAQAMVRSTIFAQNNGTSGGGLWADSSTTVMLDGCSFEYNVAQAGSGGALYSAGNLTMTASLCVGNTAQQGGSAFLQFTLPSQAVEMRDSQFWNNTALGEGAVFYMYERLTESRTAAAAQLAELQYERNSAQGGGSIIFWDPDNLTVSSQPPECLGCTEDVASAGNTAGYDSPSGWASRATGLRVAETQAEEAGGYDLVHGIEVEVTDANEEVVTNADFTVKLLNSAGSPCTFTGEGFEQRVVNGSAVFRHDLQLVGAAGDTCLLRFTAELGVEGEVSSSDTAVPLRYCVPGEYPVDGYTSGSQKCSPCAANYISFSNDTACLECTEGVTCPGVDTYVVCPGHWLAPNARYCQQHEDPTQCFLDRLYECGVKDACSSVEGEGDAVTDYDRADEDECAVGGRNNARMGSGIASVEELALCDSDAYTEGVMCGGMTLVGSPLPVLRKMSVAVQCGAPL
ncbi:hypothetical protein CYMTET_14899 [Cymbomonas tetramitiformis]|uniref:Right handed beta helix domain-containing protein n=1 Tax=Cymbomonas tetramitiformis TaxID=36881 RepID=A0AAE0GFK8_9CHLO|nr:hypothetical protein CYMTET_14899 [Cymbomonas tetramitiformis]